MRLDAAVNEADSTIITTTGNCTCPAGAEPAVTYQVLLYAAVMVYEHGTTAQTRHEHGGHGRVVRF